MPGEVLYGGGVSDWRFRNEPPKRSYVATAWNNLTESLGGKGVEIQIGFRPPPGKLQIKSQHSFIGFHQPGERKKAKNYPKIFRFLKPIIDRADILKTMKLAEQAKADYLVLHPYEVYKEGISKEKKRKKAIKFIKEILKKKKRSGHTYRLCIENLGEPGYPTSAEEMVDLLNYFKKDNLGLILDIDHHWMDFKEREQKESTKSDYYEQLTNNLSKIIKECGSQAIEGFHLAQAYSDDQGKKWIAHGLPGLRKGEKMTNATPLIFTAPEDFKGDWLNIRKVLSIIRTLVKENSIDKIKILIEANYEASEIAENIKRLEGLEN